MTAVMCQRRTRLPLIFMRGKVSSGKRRVKMCKIEKDHLKLSVSHLT